MNSDAAAFIRDHHGELTAALEAAEAAGYDAGTTGDELRAMLREVGGVENGNGGGDGPRRSARDGGQGEDPNHVKPGTPR